MGVKAWGVIPSFSVSPKKAFLGLDKTRAHCFVVPKRLYPFLEDPSLSSFLETSEHRKQRRIRFIIAGLEYPAELRWVNQNREHTRKIKPDKLPKRKLYLFQWKKFDETIAAMREMLDEAHDLVSKGETKHEHRVEFHHLGDDLFLLRFTTSDRVLGGIKVD